MVIETTRTGATLVDLLDRVLERGLIIEADVVVTLAGVPLVGISLRAAIAGMETMARYGMMGEWDRRALDAAAEPRPVAQGRGLLGAGTARPAGVAPAAKGAVELAANRH